MAGIGKWIGGVLGWALAGGPIGGMIGFALGNMIDNITGQPEAYQDFESTRRDYRKRAEQFRHNTQPGDFTASLLVLSAIVMKADGKVLKSELNFVKKFLVNNFGEARSRDYVRKLKHVLEKDVPVKEVCEEVRYFMEHSNRLLILQYLFGIALADHHLDQREFDVIQQISNYLGISKKDFESIKSMFVISPEGSYKILEIDENVTDAEVKKAYRRMANKYHPDKVSNLGEAHKAKAEETFIKVQKAYEDIKKQRGFK